MKKIKALEKFIRLENRIVRTFREKVEIGESQTSFPNIIQI
jgi:hypothetical protein